MHRRSNTSCLTEQEIEGFIFNRLSGVTREVIEEHLLACQSCLSRVEQEEEYVKAVKTAAREMEREDLERAYSGEKPARGLSGWLERAARWFGPGKQRIWAVALASVAIAGSGVLFRYHADRQAGQDVELVLYRGAHGAVEAKAQVPLRLSLNVEDLPDAGYRLELVAGSGAVAASGEAAPTRGRLLWNVGKGFSPGTYWVRLRGSGGELVREFGLTLR
jgi:hypothetical protein